MSLFLNKNRKLLKIIPSIISDLQWNDLQKPVRIPSAPARSVTPTPATRGSELRVDRVCYWANWDCLQQKFPIADDMITFVTWISIFKPCRSLYAPPPV